MSLLDLRRAGARGVHDAAQAGHVVTVADLPGEFEHPDELGGHHVRGGHRVPLDGGQGPLGVESAQDGQRLTDVQRTQIEALAARVMHAGGHQVHTVQRLEVECAPEDRHRVGGLGGVAPVQRADDALGLAGGPRRVPDGVALPAVGGRGVGVPGQKVGLGDEPARRAATTAEDDPQPGPGGAGGRETVQVVDMGDQGRGPRMVQDRGELVAGQRGVEGQVAQPDLGGRELPDHRIDVIGQRVGHHIPVAQALRAQRIGHPVRRGGQLAEGQGAAAGGCDDGRRGRVILGDPPHAEALIPRMLHQTSRCPIR